MPLELPLKRPSGEEREDLSGCGWCWSCMGARISPGPCPVTHARSARFCPHPHTGANHFLLLLLLLLLSFTVSLPSAGSTCLFSWSTPSKATAWLAARAFAACILVRAPACVAKYAGMNLPLVWNGWTEVVCMCCCPCHTSLQWCADEFAVLITWRQLRGWNSGELPGSSAWPRFTACLASLACGLLVATSCCAVLAVKCLHAGVQLQ